MESRLSSSLSPQLPPPHWPPPSKPPISLDHGLEVHRHARLIMSSKCISNLRWSQPPSESQHSLNYGLQRRTITVSKYISNLTQSQLPSVSSNTLDYGLRVRMITASKSISKLAWSWLRSASQNSLHYRLYVYLQSRPITASKCISKIARWWAPSACQNSIDHNVVNGGAGWQTAHHQRSTAPRIASEGNGWECSILARGAKGEGETIWRDTRPWWTTGIAWISKCLARECEEPQTLRGSMKPRQECMTPRAATDRVCISYNAMISIYHRVSKIYTPCHWVYLRYPHLSGCIYIERLKYYMPYDGVANLVTAIKTIMMNEMPCGCETLRTTAVRI